MNKNYFRLLLTFAVILFLGNYLSAQSFVNVGQAEEIGSNFISAKTGAAKAQLSLFHTENGTDGQPNLYIFNVEGGGFVIVSASRNMRPVLAYSTRNSYEGEIPETAWYFIESYSRNADYCDENGVMMANADLEWKALENNELPAAKNTKTVETLLQTTWNQSYPYNYYAPECQSYWNGNHCYAGCVACAMAQIMKYWDYPVQGQGSHSYYHSTYGQLSANFGETTYEWDIMPNDLGELLTDEAKAVALLMYHCGVGVDMNFGASSSGANSPDVEIALRQYFGYSAAVYKARTQYTEEEWIALLKSDLDQSRPIYFSGFNDDGGGHAIVCDGYDSNDFFSFNLGWSGMGNDYYSINDVAGFNSKEAIVMNIYPLEIRADENGIIHVDADGTGNGTSWENATPYLEYASALANVSSKQIWVKSGTYYGDIDNVNGAFNIYKNNRVYGGFTGNEGPDFNLEDRDLVANPTILDGMNTHRVLYQTDHFMTSEYSIWDGFTIQNGYSGAGGGAYLCCNSRFSNCNFLNNTADGFGGGVYAISAYYDNSTVRFNNCVFEGNSGSLGGAICDMMGVNVVNSRFSDNSAQTKGGALYVYPNKESKFVNTIFDNNSAQLGGGMYNKGKITMINCDIVKNEAEQEGGGIYNESKYNRFYNSVFWGNSKLSGYNQIYGTSTFDHCAIQGGYAGTNIINLSGENDGSDSDSYPRFIDYEAGDYSLALNSALVNAGDNSVTGVTGPDYLGNQRIVDGIIDMGAIECQIVDAVDPVEGTAFQIYPNPFDSQLIIISDGSIKVEVFNAIGQRIVNATAQDELTLNTSDWDNGIYFVKVNGATVKVAK